MAVPQVTNPPIDPLREGLVMSLEMRLGRRGNLLEPGPGEPLCHLPLSMSWEAVKIYPALRCPALSWEPWRLRQ